MEQTTRMKRQLGLLDVFCVASGAMISSGLFVLPALAFSKAGPGMILSYFIASVAVLPSVLSKAELSTAMPRAGGTYFYIERSMGPVWGIFSGFSNWFSLALKSAFAIFGMALFLQLFIETSFGSSLQPWHIKAIAVGCCVFFLILNSISVKHVGIFQVILVVVLLLILTVYIGWGFHKIDVNRFEGYLAKGWGSILATSGLVFISFGGLTKIASIAEEVKKPGKNIPQGMIAAWLVVTLFYLATIAITVGVIEGESLAKSLMPISDAADAFMGPIGFSVLSIAALAAFISTANGGILAASRSPMAMGRDQLLPEGLSNVHHKLKTPVVSILLTGGFMISAILLLDMESLVKTASTLMIILFLFDNASVIIMRESRIQSYRPRFRSPLYPYLHIFSMIIYCILIVDMGAVPLVISGAFVGLSIGWYFAYVRKRVNRNSAVMHIVERVTDKQLKTVTLENELRDILLDRDEITADRFDRLVSKCEIIDVAGKRKQKEIFAEVANILSARLGMDKGALLDKLISREAESSTIITPGLSIPHIVVEGKEKFDIVLVRACDGIDFPETDTPVHAMFVLAGSKDERNYHLQALMAIAQIAQQSNFEDRWLAPTDKEGIRNMVLLSKRKRSS